MVSNELVQKVTTLRVSKLLKYCGTQWKVFMALFKKQHPLKNIPTTRKWVGMIQLFEIRITSTQYPIFLKNEEGTFEQDSFEVNEDGSIIRHTVYYELKEIFEGLLLRQEMGLKYMYPLLEEVTSDGTHTVYLLVPKSDPKIIGYCVHKTHHYEEAQQWIASIGDGPFERIKISQ